METVGFECYNNGTVRPAIMRIKDSEPKRRSTRDEYYGSFLAKRSRRALDGKTSKKS